MPKYTFDNTVEQLLTDARVYALAKELLPDVLASPFLNMAMSYRLRDVLPLLSNYVSASALSEFKRRLELIE